MTSDPTATDRLRERIERAEREVIRLTGSGPGGQHDKHFRMTVPAEPDRDSDLVLIDGLNAGREALAALAEAAPASREAAPGSGGVIPTFRAEVPPATCVHCGWGVFAHECPASREAGLDAERSLLAWAILTAETNPNRWEPDRYNAAAFITAFLAEYARLAASPVTEE